MMLALGACKYSALSAAASFLSYLHTLQKNELILVILSGEERGRVKYVYKHCIVSTDIVEVQALARTRKCSALAIITVRQLQYD
jgi:hypothetical protein